MKVFGRIILLAVGGVLLYLSITSIMSGWSSIQSIGWENFFSQDTWNAVSSIAGQVLKAICGLYCVFLALRGKSSFFSFIIAAILIVIVVFRSIDFFNSTAEKNWNNILNLILTYLMPIGFAVGVLFLTFDRNKAK